MLHSGVGNEFVIRCAKTESMNLKEQVKNIMRACYYGVAISIYFDAAKHCNVKQIYLRSSNSIPMELLLQSTERISEEEEEEKVESRRKYHPKYFNSNVRTGHKQAK